MIGFFDYTVILTLLSVFSSLMGIFQAIGGNCVNGVLFLALSGLFDAFDGKVARTKKNRSDDEKLYGIQLDSLADIVCFGVLPAVLCFCMGLNTAADLAILGFYLLCGVIRLAYFNVLETNRQAQPESGEKVFHGLPITTASMAFPVFFFSFAGVSPGTLLTVFRILMLLLGTLFILDFQMKKLKNWQLLLFSLIVAAAILCGLLRK